MPQNVKAFRTGQAYVRCGGQTPLRLFTTDFRLLARLALYLAQEQLCKHSTYRADHDLDNTGHLHHLDPTLPL